MTPLKRLAFCLALTSSLAGVAGAWTEEESYRAFMDAGYGDCDAFVLGKYWIVSSSTAKHRAGSMMLNGHQATLDLIMYDANNIFSCASPGAIDPPDPLAEFWQTPHGW